MTANAAGALKPTQSLWLREALGKPDGDCMTIQSLLLLFFFKKMNTSQITLSSSYKVKKALNGIY